jgi:hypothetical protein
MPSAEVGGEVRRNRALNCWPWVTALTTLAAVSRARGARRPSELRQQTDPAAGAGAALRLPTDVADFFFAIPVRSGRWSAGVRGERS